MRAGAGTKALPEVARLHTLISRSILLAGALSAGRAGLRGLEIGAGHWVWRQLTGAAAQHRRYLTMEMGSVRGKRINTSDTISIVSLE